MSPFNITILRLLLISSINNRLFYSFSFTKLLIHPNQCSDNNRKLQNHIVSHRRFKTLKKLSSKSSSSSITKQYNDDDENERNGIEYVFLDEDDDEEDQDWISDRDLIRRATDSPGGEAITNRKAKTYEKVRYANMPDDNDVKTPNDNSEKKKQPKREPGYLGDSTLKEISMDFSMPICYIADVLVSWGCPIPIDVNMRLGDLVTGEQAFALLEAIHTLDVASLQDRYSNYDLMTIAQDYDIDLKEAFDYCIKKGWSLPFGVQTCLRLEHEDELIMALAEEEYTDSLDEE